MVNRTAHRFALLLLCPGLLLLFSSGVFAQVVKVTATPPSIADATKPSTVVLHVTKPDNSAVDQTFVDLLGSVKVGDATVQHQFDAARSDITITSPLNLTGAQRIQLLNKTGQPLGETTLQYPAARGQTDASSSTNTAGSNAGGGGADALAARINGTVNSPWYRISNILLFAALLAPFIYTLVRVINFSRASFRNPLGFPVGSFRAMLAFTLVAYLGFYILTSILTASDFQPPQSLLGIVATVVGFYFGTRSGEDATTDPGVSGIVRGMVRLGTNPARGAMVKFKRDDGTEPYIRITDVDGHFVVVGVKSGKYKVRAEATGSLPSDPVDLTVSEGSDQEIVVTLKPPTPPGPPAPPAQPNQPNPPNPPAQPGQPNPPGQPNQPGQPNP